MHLLIHSFCLLVLLLGSGKTLAFAIPMIHSVLQWQVKKPAPPLSNTAAAPGETGAEAGPPGKAGAGTGALSGEIGIEGEPLPSEAGTKPGAPPSKARAKTAAVISDLVPWCCPSVMLLLGKDLLP